MIEEDHGNVSQVFSALAFPTANLVATNIYRSPINALITVTSMHGSNRCYSDVQLLLQCFWVRFESLFPVVSLLHVYS